MTAHPYGVNTPAGLLMTFNVVFKLVEIYMLEDYYKHVQAGRPPLCGIACWFSMFGLMHSNNLQGHSIGADHRVGRGELTWAKRARGNVGWRFAICYGAFAGLLVAAHAGQKAGLVEPPVEVATHQQALEESVADFEESLSKDSRVSVKKDDGDAVAP